MLVSKCEYCGKEIKSKDQWGKPRRFCSRRCVNMKLRGRPEITIEVIKTMVLKGFKISQIAEALRIDKVTINRRCREAGYSPREDYGKQRAENPNRSLRDHMRGKLGTACEICGFSRAVDVAHIIPSKIGGPYIEWNCLVLCPNHHRLFDKHLLTDVEYDKITDKITKAREQWAKD